MRSSVPTTKRAMLQMHSVLTMFSFLFLRSAAQTCYDYGAHLASPHSRDSKLSSSPWPSSCSPFVECHGNYADEAFLEDHSLPLYQHQDELPRLPVPSLEDTMERFLPTALPLAETDDEIESLKEACARFPAEAAILQERLLKRAESLKDTSWLQQWWNTMGYLRVRDPIVVNVSYFFPLADSHHDKTWMRGAALLRSIAEYRDKVVSGELPQDMLGKQKTTPLCSTAYKFLFHACRIPRVDEDSYRIYDPSKHTHALLAYQNQFFILNMRHEDNGSLQTVREIKDQIRACIEQTTSTDGRPTPELGWLTSSNRDDWARAREQLLEIGSDPIKCALELLESGMVMLCLDDDEPSNLNEAAREFWHGGMTSGGNRWFDKSIQLVVSKNGKAAYVGEHSMADGMPASGICQYMLMREKELHAEAAEEEPNTVKGRSSMLDYQDTASTIETTGHSAAGRIKPENVLEDVMVNLSDNDLQKIQTLVKKAKDDFDKLTSAHDLEVKHFQTYGSHYIKSNKLSPDAYVQMAMQLATYRLFGKQAATYEATQVRPFLHGRTETTRSVSPASAAFVKSMGLQSVTHEKDTEARANKISLLREAADTHVSYIRNACRAHGVDRHFFGLSMLIKDGETPPSLFSHPLFQRAKTWRVSTSAVPYLKPGFGAVVSDGVGIGYEVQPNGVYFNVASRKENNYAGRLCHYLEEALLEMKQMFETENASLSETL